MKAVFACITLTAALDEFYAALMGDGSVASRPDVPLDARARVAMLAGRHPVPKPIRANAPPSRREARQRMRRPNARGYGAR